MAAQRDYYQLLGVAESATTDEIKKAFRRLAKQYHPDRNPNNPQAAERFKEINEAHDVLSNPEKRKKYDRLRRYGAFAGAGNASSRGRREGTAGWGRSAGRCRSPWQCRRCARPAAAPAPPRAPRSTRVLSAMGAARCHSDKGASPSIVRALCAAGRARFLRSAVQRVRAAAKSASKSASPSKCRRGSRTVLACGSRTRDPRDRATSSSSSTSHPIASSVARAST